MDTETIQGYLDNMDAKEIDAFYSINWNEVGTDGVKSWNDVLNLVHQKTTLSADTVHVKTYSDISDAISNYNDILAQTNEIAADNIKVTQEYKDSLTALGISSKELNECFDENNGLVVKNSKQLRKLVSEKNA